MTDVNPYRLHLDKDNELACTHSIAESVDAIASEAKRRGADYVRVEFDDATSIVDECRMHGFEARAIAEWRLITVSDTTPGALHMLLAMRRYDPFQSGATSTERSITIPLQHVLRPLNAHLVGSLLDGIHHSHMDIDRAIRTLERAA